MNLLFIVGARPNFVKLAPLYHELKRRGKHGLSILHTGQHADENMSGVFFRDLEIPEPDANLGVHGGNATEQVSNMLAELNVYLSLHRPDMVIVFGDVNSTLAGALAAAQHRIPVAHIEAGLRSGDMSMMEEINRIVVDRISVLHFVTEFDGYKNLRAEGFSDSIHAVGNLMVDAAWKIWDKTEGRFFNVIDIENACPCKYILATFHRPVNSDSEKNMRQIIGALHAISAKEPVIFPVHPRTMENIKKFGLEKQCKNMTIKPPFGYVDFLCALGNARAVITDSGGIQAEAWALKVPCITIRETTEQKASIERGANVLCKCDTASIFGEYENLKNRIVPPLPKLWDGKTAERIADILDDWSGN
jgi:UDP-N-acetylglucosamine 2-epimerase (non-hydrolysing)